MLRALGPTAALRASIALLRQRPLAIFAVGLALYLSTAAVVCGFGMVAAPWFACELLALLMSTGLGTPLPRSPTAWLWAGMVQMIAIIVLSSVASLALTSLGVDVGRDVGQGLLGAQLAEGLLVMVVAGGLVLSLTVCFEHAPAILIEHGGGFIPALLESSRLVSRHGLLRTWATSAVAHGMPMAAGLGLIVVLARRATLAASVGFLCLLMPLLVFALVLGQGMMVASYLHLRAQVTDPRRVSKESAPSKLGTASWAILLSCVALGPVAVSLALLKPAPPRSQALAADLPVLLTVPAKGKPSALYVPGSALRVQVATRSVHITGSDDGGAGAIPGAYNVKQVRVAQAHGVLPELLRRAPAESTFGVEMTLADGRVLTTWVDEAGVRLDDSLSRRFAARLSPTGGLALILCFAWTAFWIARSLPPLGRIRRKLVGQRPAGLADDHEMRLRTALRARALGTSLWLVPPALGSVTIGLSALLR